MKLSIYIDYIYICDPKISKNTPEINRKTLKTNYLLKDNLSLIKEKQDNLKKIDDQRAIPKNENDYLDYGDILEFAYNGDKQEIFFIKNSIFCLKEKS